MDNILVIGDCSRTSVFVDILAKSSKIKKIYVLTEKKNCVFYDKVELININIEEDYSDLIKFIKKQNVKLVVPTSEKFLVRGIVDVLKEKNIICFGPNKLNAKIEGSKIYSKYLMKDFDIPTSDFKAFQSDEIDIIKKYIFDEFIKSNYKCELVLKADGLCGGKGVVVPKNMDELIKGIDLLVLKKKFGKESENIILEKKLYGREVSVMGFCNGKRVYLMPQSKDYKRRYNYDKGPNTGGMGAIAGIELLGKVELKKIENYMNIIVKKLNYKGILYAGIMMCKDGTNYFLEFNCRSGCTETESLFQLLDSDLYDIMVKCMNGEEPNIKWKKDMRSVNVVLSHKSYPEKNKEKLLIELEGKLSDDVKLYWGNLNMDDGLLFTTGGRVACIVSTSDDIFTCMDNIYKKNIKKINYKDMDYRRDIGCLL